MFLNIRLDMSADYDGTAEHLAELLLSWAGHGGYRLAVEQPGRWVFQRGGRWGALLVLWDVYALPCEVTVSHLSLNRQVLATLVCTSWFHAETGGDRPKLEAELGRLRAMLCDTAATRWGRQERHEDGIVPPGPTNVK